MNYCSYETVNQGCKLSISFKFMVGQHHQSAVSPIACSLKTNSPFIYFILFYFFSRTYHFLQAFKMGFFAQSPRAHLFMSSARIRRNSIQCIGSGGGCDTGLMLYYSGHQTYSFLFRQLHPLIYWFFYWASFCHLIDYCYCSGLCSFTFPLWHGKFPLLHYSGDTGPWIHSTDGYCMWCNNTSHFLDISRGTKEDEGLISGPEIEWHWPVPANTIKDYPH